MTQAERDAKYQSEKKQIKKQSRALLVNIGVGAATAGAGGAAAAGGKVGAGKSASAGTKSAASKGKQALKDKGKSALNKRGDAPEATTSPEVVPPKKNHKEKRQFTKKSLVASTQHEATNKREKAKSVVGDGVRGAAKGAVQGAVAGAAAGGVGALPGTAIGAVKSGAMELGKNKHFRAFIVIVLVALIALPLAGLGISTVGLIMLASASDQDDTHTSMVAANESGIEEDDVLAAKKAVEESVVPWEIYLSITRSTGEKPDVAKLDAEARHRSRNSSRDMSAGLVYKDSSTARQKGTSASAKKAAAAVKKVWSGAIAAVLDIPKESAESIYDQALAWHMGQKSNICPPVINKAGRLEKADNGLWDTGASSEGAPVYLSDDQLANADVIISQAKAIFSQKAIQQNAALVGISTAMQESTLQNLRGGDRDSVGLFQQRPSMGWGSVDQILNPAYASAKFFSHLIDIDGWEAMPVAEAAQAVQVSAFPDAYAKWQPMAQAVVDSQFYSTKAGSVPKEVDIPTTSGDDSAPATNCVGIVADGEAVHPLGDTPYLITDYFGPRPAPCFGCSTFHTGVDMGTACETPIYAAMAGRVTLAGFYGTGGQTVIIDHGDGIETLYMHQVMNGITVKVGDDVDVGDLIGHVGSTGASTGCHLHLSVQEDGTRIDPISYMKQFGVKI